MDNLTLINGFILVGGLLIVLSVIAGMFSARLGAPILLVFLVLGMLAGENGVGIEFSEPAGGLLNAVSFGVVNALSREYLAALVAGELAGKHHVITAYTLNNPNVIRLEPPLAIATADIDHAVASLDEVLGRFRSIMSAALSSVGHAAGAAFGRKKD